MIGSPSTSTPRANRRSALYEDDRVTRDYKQAKSATQLLEVTAPVAARGDVTVKIGASKGSYAGKPAARPYELTVHTGTAPRDVSVDNVELNKQASKDAYLAAATGWYYENGVILVKTASISTCT